MLLIRSGININLTLKQIIVVNRMFSFRKVAVAKKADRTEYTTYQTWPWVGWTHGLGWVGSSSVKYDSLPNSTGKY